MVCGWNRNTAHLCVLALRATESREDSPDLFLKKSVELSTARQVDTLCEGKRGQRLVKKWKRESGGEDVAVSN